MKRSGAIRLLQRLLMASVGIVVTVLVSIQFARIIRQNVAMADSLTAVQRDVAMLHARERKDERQIRRLLTPQGAVPEIHQRLRLVEPGQALIYLREDLPR